jgi:precorrin-2 dehydrogenase / sirohydrochlorin ferrochelatase
MTVLSTSRVAGNEASASHPSESAFAFPVFLEVRNRTVFVAGGGHETTSKAATLAGLGARVRVWATDHHQTAALGNVPGVELCGGPFDANLLERAFLAIVGTGDRSLDRWIATEARTRGILVNTVDDIPFCDFSMPAVLRRGGLTVAFGTGGIAPALAVRLRDGLAEELGDEYAELLALLGELRPRIMATGRTFADRRRLWYELIDGPAIVELRAGRPEEARRVLDETVEAWLEAAG